MLALLTACAGHTPLERNLPPVPNRLTQAPAIPALDSACRFPFFGVEACRGKNQTAMLRLAVSDDLELRRRLAALPAWYEGVRRSYQTGKAK